MIKVKIFPVMADRGNESHTNIDVARVEKMVAEYRLFGILLLRKELIMPTERYYENFFTKF